MIHLYEVSRKGKVIETETRLAGRGGGGGGELLLNGTRVSVQGDENSGDGCNTL